jgi:hypothetical protein
MSDRKNVLSKAVNDVLPHAKHSRFWQRTTANVQARF